MADDFGAENLEDGELWLPSDFFSKNEVQVSSRISTPFDYCSPSMPSCREDFQRFYDSIFLQRHPHNRVSYEWLPALQPAAWCGSSGVANGGAHDPSGCRTGYSCKGYSSIDQLHRVNSVPIQFQTFMGERAWTLQRHLGNQFN